MTTTGSGATLARNDRWALVAAIVLSLATLASAWSGYQASRWGGETVKLNRAATVARFEATRAGDLADRQITIDVMVFSSWLEAQVAGETALAASFRDRFRDEFVPAFDAWLADSGPDGGPDDGGPEALPAGSPFDRAEYVLASSTEGDRLLGVAQAQAARADEASQMSDSFVLCAVLYASVLFLAGIAARLRGARAAHVAVGLSVTMFVVAVTFMTALHVAG